MSSTGGGWAQLRQQARSLETQTETLFHTYSQYASMSNIPPKPTEEEQRTEAQLQDILERRETLISQLSRLLDSESALNTSALKSNNLSRHREILLEHRRELTRLGNLITTARSRANLLSSVRDDISAYHNSNPSNPAQAEADYMLDERTRIERSHGVADSVLSQAYAVNESFGVQRETLASVNRRIVGAASQIPGINSLMSRIGAKKRRDGIILASFVAFCFLLLLWFR
ncbi:vesicle transport V-SNARE protein [Aulographum hederae CBS 113979]|uniref:Golgi SNAP receptor complex member 1 n=1 Tax=Aulographum hederae CBS 113979 TaxID=1176131 RepID=A0A6G1GJG3_9PEZI|nr:vesicle transport V-SNARE protein [Aulographum hederae CBS 113979]